MLPAGLTLHTNSGVISGVPTSAATNTFRIGVRDAAAQTAEKDFVLAVTNMPPMPPDCLVHWKFDETNGIVALDSTGNGDIGILRNGPIRTNGMVGRALHFDGSNDRVQASNSASLSVTGALTLALWVRPESLSESRYLLVKGRGSNQGDNDQGEDNDDQGENDQGDNNQGDDNDQGEDNNSQGYNDDQGENSEAYALRTSSGRVRYLWRSPSGSRNVFQTTPVVLTVGVWTHVTVVHVPGSAPIFYTNGVVVPSARVDGSATALRGRSSGAFAVGASAEPSDHFRGTLDEVVVCTGTLTVTEIQGLMAGMLPAMPRMAANPSPMALPASLSILTPCLLRVADGVARVSWPAVAGQVYRVQFKNSLAADDWRDLFGEVYGAGEEATAEETVDERTQRFYRVVLQE